MSWIKTVPYKEATGRLRNLYDRVKGPDNNVDNIMMVHSLRPHSMEGHMAIYKYVLHHTKNKIPKWFLETLGVWVSHLNNCNYCVEHHFGGLKRLLGDDTKAHNIRVAIENNDISLAPLDEKQKSAMRYAELLNNSPSELTEDEMNNYRAPFLTREDRQPTLDWPRQIPIAGEPVEMVELVNNYATWLSKNDLPKLFINAKPGSILTGKPREFCRKWLNQKEVTVKGTHFIQEDSPQEIGNAIRNWILSLR